MKKNVLHPPAFAYVRSVKVRWFLAILVLSMASLLTSLVQRRPEEVEYREIGIVLLGFAASLRIIRPKPGSGFGPREVELPRDKCLRVRLPARLAFIDWLQRPELLILPDALELRSRFSLRRVAYSHISSITPLPSALVIELIDGERVEIRTCRLPGAFGPADVAFDHALRAAGFAALSYNERLAHMIEGHRKVVPSAYRTKASIA